jgi:hypothetical protein
MSVPGGASTRLQLGGLYTEDCHCCSQMVLIVWFAMVEMVAGRLGSSWETQFLAQDSWDVARGG